MKINWKKTIGIFTTIFGTSLIGLSIVGEKRKGDSTYKKNMEQKNPMEGKKVIFVENREEPENADGVRGHLEAVGDSDYTENFYEKHVKRVIDIILSFGGLVIFSPLLVGIAIAIKIDDPGPALFTQKRVGKNKAYFKLHKFRSMKMSTPHDTPTHMLENPEQYITKVGKFLRSHSLDELPQIWDIFVGDMSVVGPRPGLWNQDVLIAERDKYGANNVKPGLTGWAQINGRDELEISDKAKLDGEYVKKIGLWMDIKCFLGSLSVFGGDSSVVEGGTGEIKKEIMMGTDTGMDERIEIPNGKKKKILITGAGSYIGESVKKWLLKHPENYEVISLDMMTDAWKKEDFSQFDVVYHVAGIAHADVGNVSEEQKKLYYKVNTDLAVEVANQAKKAGVKQFIFMSSMIVYSGCKEKIITKNTIPKPLNFYGDSKWQADQKIRVLEDENFKVVILRPPMIYGKGSKGNYPELAKLAGRLPVFPKVKNKRSMLHIDNLCEFVKLMIDNEESGVFFPQNGEYTNTSNMVQMIAEVKGHRIFLISGTNLVVKLLFMFPGKIGSLAEKAFGDSAYDLNMSSYKDNYRINSLKRSIELTEK